MRSKRCSIENQRKLVVKTNKFPYVYSLVFISQQSSVLKPNILYQGDWMLRETKNFFDLIESLNSTENFEIVPTQSYIVFHNKFPLFSKKEDSKNFAHNWWTKSNHLHWNESLGFFKQTTLNVIFWKLMSFFIEKGICFFLWRF